MKDPKVRSYISRKNGYIVSIASIIEIMSEYLDHYVNSGVEKVLPGDLEDVKKVLGYICGMAPFMPADGVYGWTFSLPFKKRKIFASLNKNERTYVCRTHKWEPDKHENTPRVALQMLSEMQNINRVSLVDIDSDNIPAENLIEKLMKRYYSNEEKVKVHSLIKNDQLIILKPFPSCSMEVFEDVSERLTKDPENVVRRLEILENFNFSFFCGCSADRISDIFSNLKKEDKDFLFKKDDVVTTECPRCGKKYEFTREQCSK